MSLNCDITQLPNYSTWLANASVGSHTIGLTAKPSSGSQYYLESDKTTTAGGTTMTWNVYSISATATNVTASASNATKMDVVNSKTLTFTADGSSYKMPTSITVGSTSIEAGTETTVSGVATFLYTRTSDTDGSVKISNPNSATYNVSFTVEGEAVQGVGGTVQVKYTFNGGGDSCDIYESDTYFTSTSQGTYVTWFNDTATHTVTFTKKYVLLYVNATPNNRTWTTSGGVSNVAKSGWNYTCEVTGDGTLTITATGGTG